MYDVIVIGGGPGGYMAAERAGHAGLKVLLAEKENLGGVCLNHGCVPTKSLLNSAKLYRSSRSSSVFGVDADNVTFNFGKAMRWKEEVVKNMVKGVGFLMEENGVTVIKGEAVLLSDRRVRINDEIHDARNIIIAAGSSPFIPPVPGADTERVITSRDLLALEELPKSLTVIGGGVIGMEFASLFSSVGVKVSVVEMLDEVLPMMDRRIARIVRKEMKEVVFHLGAKVTSIEGGTVHFTGKTGGGSISSDYILMAVGRKANLRGFEEAGIALSERGVAVDDRMRTNVPGIYAVGDVTGLSMLAHSAYRMAEVAVNNITGKKDIMRFNAVPWALYTYPEAAGCGITEDEAKKRGIEVKIGTSLMKSNSRFYAEHGPSAGMCKVVADSGTGVILGIHLVGGVSSELVAGAAAVIEAELRVNELKDVIFPHPSLSEVIREAVWQIE